MMRLPGSPPPIHPTAALRGSHLASLCQCACCPARLEVSFVDNPGRTYPLGAHGSSPGALAKDPRPVASKAMPMLLEMARLLDFLATDLIFGVSEMAPPPRCARAWTVSHLVVIA